MNGIDYCLPWCAGIICPDGDCRVKYTREEGNETTRNDHYFEYYDKTVSSY